MLIKTVCHGSPCIPSPFYKCGFKNTHNRKLFINYLYRVYKYPFSYLYRVKFVHWFLPTFSDIMSGWNGHSFIQLLQKFKCAPVLEVVLLLQNLSLSKKVDSTVSTIFFGEQTFSRVRNQENRRGKKLKISGCAKEQKKSRNLNAAIYMLPVHRGLRIAWK